MVAPQPGDGRDAVEPRHVQVDDHRRRATARPRARSRRARRQRCRRRQARAGARSDGESASRKGASSSARRTRIVPAASASSMDRQVSLARRVFATSHAAKSPSSVRRSTSAPGAAALTWALPRSATRGWRRVSATSATSTWTWATSRPRSPEATDVGDEHARFLAPDQGDVRADRRSSSRARHATSSIPVVLGGDHSVALGNARSGLRGGARPGGAIWIDAHGDLNSPETTPERQRARHGARRGARARRRSFRERGLGVCPRVEPERVALVGRPLARRRRARAARRSSDAQGVHDERRRSSRGRACDPRGARARRRRRASST